MIYLSPQNKQIQRYAKIIRCVRLSDTKMGAEIVGPLTHAGKRRAQRSATSANAAGTNSLTCLRKHGGAGDYNFGHPSAY
jgi:hypothetical protein